MSVEKNSNKLFGTLTYYIVDRHTFIVCRDDYYLFLSSPCTIVIYVYVFHVIINPMSQQVFLKISHYSQEIFGFICYIKLFAGDRCRYDWAR